MFFNSIDFAVFFPILFFMYWFVVNKNLKAQNLLIVIASYIFYGWWDWRFLFLIFFSTVVDFSIGINLSNQKKLFKRKCLLWTSVFVNISLLGFFKYFNFFIDNFNTAFSFFGFDINNNSLNIILPVGISFYTFQTLSYTIDVYRDKLKPTKDFVVFTAFVSFFPQLVAGPIERATNLLPQFEKNRIFKYSIAVDGLRQILWGLFKKIVIADNAAQIANEIFNHSSNYSGSTLILGAIFFAFQIYGDFSGYSDIAIGISRLLGFDLMQNFAFPYFSRDIAEFWRRWHISLSTWFRDYVYIPLGGSRGGLLSKIRNTFIIFIVSGFWHGANWTFIIWGALNALYFLPLLLMNKNRKNLNAEKQTANISDIISILTTFSLTVFAWIFFRANNVAHACQYIKGIFTMSLFTLPKINMNTMYIIEIVCITILFISTEWQGRKNKYAIERMFLKNARIRNVFYFVLFFFIFIFLGEEQEFIYFQF